MLACFSVSVNSWLVYFAFFIIGNTMSELFKAITDSFTSIEAVYPDAFWTAIKRLVSSTSADVTRQLQIKLCGLLTDKRSYTQSEHLYFLGPTYILIFLGTHPFFLSKARSNFSQFWSVYFTLGYSLAENISKIAINCQSLSQLIGLLLQSVATTPEIISLGSIN